MSQKCHLRGLRRVETYGRCQTPFRCQQHAHAHFALTTFPSSLPTFSSTKPPSPKTHIYNFTERNYTEHGRQMIVIIFEQVSLFRPLILWTVQCRQPHTMLFYLIRLGQYEMAKGLSCIYILVRLSRYIKCLT